MKNEPVAATDRGYAPALGNRQVQMIAIGGAIGVGLFLGSGGRFQQAGPGLVLAYAIAGFAAFCVMRALGELVLHRPTSGSFVEYAYEFIGPWAGFAAGWMYWVNWAFTGVAELTAIGIYVHKWLPDLPQWITALVALVAVLAVNLLSVRLFGELEFWFSVLKVTVIVLFLVTAVFLVVTTAKVDGGSAGVSNLTSHDGFFPLGLAPVLMSLQAVVFAYSAIEMVGIAAGETKDPRKVLPRAINGVIWRIAVFYVGSILLLAMVLPWTLYGEAESPFVTVFSRLGVPHAGDVMNLVVITAAASSCNSGLYSTGRILRAMALRGEAPRLTSRVGSRHVPYGGILLTACVYVGGVVLYYLVGPDTFHIATAVASLGVLSTWGTLVFCQMRLRKAALRGQLQRPSFRLPGAPVTAWLTLGFLLLVLVLMAFADLPQRIAFWSLPGLALVIAIGWRVVSARRATAEAAGSSGRPGRPGRARRPARPARRHGPGRRQPRQAPRGRRPGLTRHAGPADPVRLAPPPAPARHGRGAARARRADRTPVPGRAGRTPGRGNADGTRTGRGRGAGGAVRRRGRTRRGRGRPR
ncbi:amino acid permease [Bailinhaonella thermotolerans]|uniref:Amino acid permease n=1 Tax=Bailinhaonella thermotolerans TaxID=1070861 RepID=A0A3A4ARI1_9ACTN|nr:amino acid permease [Bailinhaonella thermotolerans]RJL31219.1 amino acid permease [Bailinhaonella thermotolerans]